MIYLILSAAFRENNNGGRNYFPLLKIGYTKDNKKEKRFINYKLHNPTCKILYEIPGGNQDIENRIQYKFRNLLFEDYGREWFKYDEEIIDFFKNIKSLEDIENNLPKGNSDKDKYLKYKNKVKEILKYVSDIPRSKKFYDLCEEIFDIFGDKISNEEYTMNYLRLRFGEEKVNNYENIIKSKKTGIYCENFEINRRVSEFIREFDEKKTYYEKMRFLCESNLSNEEIEMFLYQLPDSDIIKSHYKSLGPQKLKSISYNSTRANKELGIVMFSPELLMDEIYSNFKEGEKYTLSNLKMRLGDIYSSINYSSTPKANDIEKWFDVKEISVYEKNLDGSRKKIRGYELLKSKERELRQELRLVQ